MTTASAERLGSYTETLGALLADYTGTPINVSFRELVGPLPADELTHSAFPYPARLLRQIPRMLLASDQVMDGIDLVVDPFCGSGTVLVEAQRAGIQSYGIEQNPLGALASRVKTTPIDLKDFNKACLDILRDAKRTRRRVEPSAFVKRWYSAEAYSALCRLSNAATGHEGALADAVALTLALTVRRVADTDKRIHVPVRPKDPVPTRSDDVWGAWEREASKLSRKLTRIAQLSTLAHVTLGDARDPAVWTQAQGRRALILTSPPYGAAQKYIRSSSLELGWLGFASDKGTIALEHNSIGREHLGPLDRNRNGMAGSYPNIEVAVQRAYAASPSRGAIYAAYFRDMERSIAEMSTRAARVVFIAGTNTVAGNEIATHELLAEILFHHGFRRTLSLRDEIRGRLLLTKRRSEAMPSHAEYIEIFERRD